MHADHVDMNVITATDTGTSDLLAELSRVLFKQRGHIEMLQYRLECQQLICATAKERRLQIAVEEVEAAMDEIRRSERMRDAVVQRCAAAFGLAADASLADIRDRTPEPWAAMLAEHQEALLRLVDETEALAARNRELALRGAQDTRALLEAVTGSSPTTSYGPAPRRGLTPPALLDQQV